jgi:antitoxin PrlF
MVSRRLSVVSLWEESGIIAGGSQLESRSSDASNGCSRAGPARVLEVAHIDIAWHHVLMDATVVLGQQGRLVIPAEARAALGLAPGDRLYLHLVGRRLVLERQQDAVAELRGLAVNVPKTQSLVDELLADRRVAADTAE